MQMYEKRSSARRMFTYFVLIDVVARMGHRGKKEKKKRKKEETITFRNISFNNKTSSN